MSNDEYQFSRDALKHFEMECKEDLRKLRRQLRAAEAFEKRAQQELREDYLKDPRRTSSKPEHTFSGNKNDYPDWAPQSLLNRLSILRGEPGDNFGQREYVEMLEMLCTNDRMGVIWAWLSKNFQKSDSNPNFDVLAYRFSRCAYDAFHGMKAWNALTQRQGEKKLSEIVGLIEKLSNVLEEYPLSESIFEDFYPEELDALNKSFLNTVLREMLFDVPMYFRFKIEDHADAIAPRYRDYRFISRKNPTLSELLKRVEHRLKRSDFNSITTNGSESGRLRYFIRIMAGFMKEHYGSRKDAQLAELGNIFFDRVDLDSKKVADLFR